MTGSAASADVVCTVPSRYVEWNVEDLKKMLAKKSNIKSAFESLLAVNVAHKLAAEATH